MACRNGAGGDDGLSFVLEMVGFLLLRPYLIVCQDIVKYGFLSDVLFTSGNFFLGLDDLSTKELESISTLFAGTFVGNRPAEIREESSSEAEVSLRANRA